MAPNALTRPGPHAGFTYIGVLLLVALMGMLLASFGTVASAARQRDREQELLFIGGQFRRAIALYYQATPGPVKRYPPGMNELLKDMRGPAVQRHLRKKYSDPITGKAEWGVVEGPGGEVMGVYSLSDAKPVKTANFSEADQAFEGKATYADWKFIFVPAAIAASGVIKN
jgi:type II secretory pathway pseudopilin PulG